MECCYCNVFSVEWSLQLSMLSNQRCHDIPELLKYNLLEDYTNKSDVYTGYTYNISKIHL